MQAVPRRGRALPGRCRASPETKISGLTSHRCSGSQVAGRCSGARRQTHSRFQSRDGRYQRALRCPSPIGAHHRPLSTVARLCPGSDSITRWSQAVTAALADNAATFRVSVLELLLLLVVVLVVLVLLSNSCSSCFSLLLLPVTVPLCPCVKLCR